MTEPGYALNAVAAGNCVPHWTVDLFPPPPYDPNAPILLTEAPYVDGAAVTMTPLTIAYGDGQDRTVTFGFESLHVFRQFADPRYNTILEVDYEPSVYWRPGYTHTIPERFSEWTRRTRDASGTFTPWRRSDVAPTASPITLTPAAECGGSVATGGIVFDLPPVACPWTVHWNFRPTQDWQIVFPVPYWAIDLPQRKFIGTSGFAFVQVNIAGSPPLAVSMQPGVTNGKVFSIDVTVTNGTDAAVTDLAFTHPEGIVVTPATGTISQLTGLSPPLPTSLAAGASAKSTATFSVTAEGQVDLFAQAAATDGGGAAQTGSVHATVQIGQRRLTTAELQRVYSDALIDTSQANGALLNAYQQRLGLITSWATGPQGADTIPPWLNVSVLEQPVVPAGTTFAEPVGWKVSAARALGMDDRAFAWLPDDPLIGYHMYETFRQHVASSSAKVIVDSGIALHSGLAYVGEFYGQLSSGNEAFKAEASREFSGMVSDLGDAATKTITVLGAIAAISHDDDPLSMNLHMYETSPVLRDFQKQSTQAIDAVLTATGDKTAQLARKAQVDPVGASADLGDLVGATGTKLARDIALMEVGAAGVARLGTAIEATLPFGRVGASIDGGLAAAEPSTAALTASVDGTGEVVVRQSLESLGEGTALTPAQMEALGGFYAEDAAGVQKIINEINAKYGVNIEIQVRPGNPASLPYYRNGTGVPKPEWVKPKNTEWMDLPLGAPQDSLGKATVFKPKLPTPEALTEAGYSPSQQATIFSRYKTQLELYEDATTPGGKFAKLIADSKNAEGASVSVGFGTGTREIKGLRYSLQPVGEGGDAFVVIDDAAGGKFVLSDADYQAVVDANTGRHLPAGKRGQIELEVMNRFKNETVSFGGHGWSHSGFDLPSKYSKPFVQFVTESSSPAAARRTLDWFVGKGPLPEWLQKISDGLAAKLGRVPTNAELVDGLLEVFRPGSFVVKFNGIDVRVGYGAGIR
ncbi:MAG: hypothetical protein U0807_13820 [Candidatus Binatia bacterium]